MSEGADQVNTAVSQRDRVTQANASCAEESASAADQMAAQAQAVKGMVYQLTAVIGGSRNRSQANNPSTTPMRRAEMREKKANNRD